jgi:hypothetical protein
MASLKNLVSELKDPNDYDGAVIVAIKDGAVANFGFTGGMPQGIDQRKFLYNKLMEAAFALAFFPQQPAADEKSDTTVH